MTTARSLKITADAAGTGTIEIDGMNIENVVRGLDISIRAGDPPTISVELDLTVVTVEITSLAEAAERHLVNLSAEVSTVLQAMGWTPPAEPTNEFTVPKADWQLDTRTLGSWDIRDLPEGCHCFELDHHHQFFIDGTHHERCPVFVIDNQSPDAND